MIKAALFDVYGTCVDWRAGVASFARPMLRERGCDTRLAEKIADHWRALYDPSMAPVRSGKQPYKPLDEIQRENLDVVLEQYGLDVAFDGEARTLLNAAWDQLPAWPDTCAALTKLKSVMPIAACSNGSKPMMQRLANYNAFSWTMICGADIARTYKPVHAVYQRSAEALGSTPAETIMIACHADDLDEAKKAGLKPAFFHVRWNTVAATPSTNPMRNALTSTAPPLQDWLMRFVLQVEDYALQRHTIAVENALPVLLGFEP